jgi:hypothetical protein
MEGAMLSLDFDAQVAVGESEALACLISATHCAARESICVATALESAGVDDVGAERAGAAVDEGVVSVVVVLPAFVVEEPEELHAARSTGIATKAPNGAQGRLFRGHQLIVPSASGFLVIARSQCRE